MKGASKVFYKSHYNYHLYDMMNPNIWINPSFILPNLTLPNYIGYRYIQEEG